MELDKKIKELQKQITFLKKENRRLHKLAYVDELTQLFNRRALIETGNKYLKSIIEGKKLKRRKKSIKYLTVIFLDLDNFKQINDKFSHRKGDKVLKEFALFLKRNFRSTDIIGRWGGEEFVVLMIDVPYFISKRKAERIRKKIEDSVFNKLKITASVGVVPYTKEKDISELLHKADQLMYQAKKRGKNQVICF